MSTRIVDEIAEKAGRLPEELQRELADFAEFLARRRKAKSGYRLKQDWAGAMKEYRDQYTALELQKKTLEWRGD
jgi:hypothetical protein